MSNSLATILPLGVVKLSSASFDTPNDYVQSAIVRGLFDSYNESLYGGEFFCGGNFNETLEKALHAKLGKRLDEVVISLAHMFAICTDPKLHEEDRMLILENELKKLPPHLIDELHYSIAKMAPHGIAITILRYAPRETFEKVIEKCIYIDPFKVWQVGLNAWIKEVTYNSWAPIHKFTFLRTLFDLVPQSFRRDLLYYFAKNANDQERAEFHLIVPEKLSKELLSLEVETQEILDEVDDLQDLEARQHYFSFNGAVEDCGFRIDRAAESLIQIIHQKSLADIESDRAFQQVYYALDKEAQPKVIRRVIEEITPESFVHFITLLKRAVGSSYEMDELIASFLESAHDDKLDFLAQVFQATKCQFEIEGLWQSPYLTTDEERACVVKRIAADLGEDFVSFFYFHLEPANLIQTLKNTDPQYAIELFVECVDSILESQSSVAEQFRFCQQFFQAYAKVEFDLLSLILENKKWHMTFRSWFSNTELLVSHLLFDKTALQLLSQFNREGFELIVLEKIHMLIQVDLHSEWELDRIISALELMGAESERIKKDPEMVQYVRDLADKKNILEMFDIKKMAMTRLAVEILPNWQERLAKSAIEEVRRAVEEGHGFEYLPSTCKSLHAIGKLDEWLSVLRDLDAEVYKKIIK